MSSANSSAADERAREVVPDAGVTDNPPAPASQPNGIPDPEAGPRRHPNWPVAVFPKDLELHPPHHPIMPFNVVAETSFIICIVSCGFMVFLLIACVSLIVWVLLHPVVPQLHVGSANLSAVEIDGTKATGDCGLTLLVDNHNPHMTAIYDRMEIALIYPSTQTLLSEYYPEPFVQTGHNRTTVRTTLNFGGVDLGTDGAKAMKEDLDRRSLTLGLKIRAMVRYRNNKLGHRARIMKGYCTGVSFAFTSGDNQGMFLNPYLICDAYLFGI